MSAKMSGRIGPAGRSVDIVDMNMKWNGQSYDSLFGRVQLWIPARQTPTSLPHGWVAPSLQPDSPSASLPSASASPSAPGVRGAARDEHELAARIQRTTQVARAGTCDSPCTAKQRCSPRY
jgi:hypothetical protein